MDKMDKAVPVMQVCPFCLSKNISVARATGFYNCKNCGRRLFYPFELNEKQLKMAKEKIAENAKSPRT